MSAAVKKPDLIDAQGHIDLCVLRDKLLEKGMIAIIWDVNDVKEACPGISTKRAKEVLRYADRKHDAEIGINWDTFRAINDILD
jgi:hypothetical protein